MRDHLTWTATLRWGLHVTDLGYRPKLNATRGQVATYSWGWKLKQSYPFTVKNINCYFPNQRLTNINRQTIHTSWRQFWSDTSTEVVWLEQQKTEFWLKVSTMAWARADLPRPGGTPLRKNITLNQTGRNAVISNITFGEKNSNTSVNKSDQYFIRHSCFTLCWQSFV